MNIKLYRIYKDTLYFYKRKTNWISHIYNFIWKVNKSLNLFIFDNYHLRILANNTTWIPAIKKYLSLETDDIDYIINFIIDKCKSKRSGDILQYIRFEDKSDYVKFTKMFDGIEIEDNYFTFKDIIYNSILIDGNEKRFGIGRDDIDINIPDFVIDELLRYTENASIKIKKEVKDWLKNNPIKKHLIDNFIIQRICFRFIIIW